MLNVKWFDYMLNSMHDLSTLHVLNTYGMVLSVSICLRFLFVGKFTFHKHDYILLEHLSINAKVIWIFSFSKVWVERWVQRKVWCCSPHISRISAKKTSELFCNLNLFSWKKIVVAGLTSHLLSYYGATKRARRDKAKFCASSYKTLSSANVNILCHEK